MVGRGPMLVEGRESESIGKEGDGVGAARLPKLATTGSAIPSKAGLSIS